MRLCLLEGAAAVERTSERLHIAHDASRCDNLRCAAGPADRRRRAAVGPWGAADPGGVRTADGARTLAASQRAPRSSPRPITGAAKRTRRHAMEKKRWLPTGATAAMPPGGGRGRHTGGRLARPRASLRVRCCVDRRGGGVCSHASRPSLARDASPATRPLLPAQAWCRVSATNARVGLRCRRRTSATTSNGSGTRSRRARQRKEPRRIDISAALAAAE